MSSKAIYNTLYPRTLPFWLSGGGGDHVTYIDVELSTSHFGFSGGLDGTIV